MRDLANIWIGCGCLFLLIVVVGSLAILTAGGGQGGVLAGLALVGVGAYFLWTYRTNHYHEHGCRIEYLYTDNAFPKRYTRSQVGRDIPREIAERHPDHVIDL